MSERRVVGRATRRLDAVEKVTGAAKYAIDLSADHMLHGAVVRAQRAHARITAIDKAAALALPGVVAVVTGEELGPLFPRFGHIIADHPVLAIDKVRYWGEPVALVLGETPHEAHDGAAAVWVDYEDLPAVMAPAEALAPGAVVLHDDEYDDGDASFAEARSSNLPPNVAHEVDLGWGDVDSALAEAALVVESTTHYPMLYAYAMEPYNALAAFTGDRLEVDTTAQHPYMVREDLARIFSLPLSQVRVRTPYIGGGYGSKSYTKVEPIAAVGSWYTRRPVKVAVDVEGAIYTTRADSADIRVRSAFAEDGTLLARDFDITFDTGAYADNGPLVLTKCANRCFGPYRIPNLRVRGRAVYTNTAPSSSYRGFGAPQGNFAGETNMDRAAEALGMDAKELRHRNLAAKGEVFLPGKRALDADLGADLDLLAAALDKHASDDPLYGVGFGCSASDAGAFPTSTVLVRLAADGSVTLLTGATEMGQGSRTALSQIVAEELGVPLEHVGCVQSDTAVTPYERTTGASRTTTLVGLAAQRACADLRARLAAMAAEEWDAAVGDIGQLDAALDIPDAGPVPFEAVLTRWFRSRTGEVVGFGVVRRHGELEALPPFWEIGMAGVGVRIDPETGVVSVDNLVTVADVGFAINPAALEGQDLGAAMQGLGAALHEELVYDGPHPVNPNVVDYQVPRASDIPAHIDNIVVERGDGTGPYGAKGGGEGTLNPIGGAVASAVACITGRWPDRLPLTPERVWRLLRQGPSPEVGTR